MVGEEPVEGDSSVDRSDHNLEIAMEPGRLRPGFAVPRLSRRWLLVVPLVGLLVLFILPLLSILPQAFGWPHVTLSQFNQIFAESAYLHVLETTVLTSLIVTAITLVVAYPLAWTMSQCGARMRAALGLLILVPFLISALVMTFSWVAILGQNGLVNDVLMSLGLESTRTSFLFSRFAVVVALVQTSIPFMVLPLFATMRKLDPRIVKVAESLGAPRLRALRSTVLPLSMPGIRIGVTIVFLYSMAAFIAPSVLGGPSDTMVGQLIESEIESGLSWGFASAFAILLVAVCVLVVAIITLVFGRATRWQNPRNDGPVMPEPAASAADEAERIVAVPTRRPVFGFASRPGVLRAGTATYLVLIATYVLGPLVVIIPLSFTSAPAMVFPPPGWSTQWYTQAATDGQWLHPFLTSLEIAGVTTVIACALALLATLGFGRARARGQGLTEATFNTPLMVPAVVYALGAYLFFAKLHLIDTFIGIVLAETVLVFPVAYLIINTAYRAVEPALERASASLGASPITTLRRVILPLMRPGLLTAALLCLLLTIDESVVSIFLSDVNVVTLARQMWEALKFNTSPEIAAVSTVLVAIAVLIVVVSFAVFSRLSGRRNLVDVLARSE